MERFYISQSGLKKNNSSEPLLFFHVPKTGGTTLSTILKACLGESMCEARSQHVLDQLGGDCQKYDFISGHFIKEPVYANFRSNQILTIFRNPIDRIISQYSNWSDSARIEYDSPAWRLTEVAQEAIKIAQNSSLEGFLSSDNDEIVANTNNVLTRAFCNEATNDPREISPSMVDSAFENLRSFFWLGLLERMHESVVMLARQLCIPEIIYGDLQIHNPSKSKPHISDEARRILKHRTSLDRKLYGLVQSEFDRRLSVVLTESVRTTVILHKNTNLMKFECSSALDDQYFIAGWSFPEETADGRCYRWSYGGVDASIVLPLAMSAHRSEVQLEARLVNLGNGIVEGDVEILLDYTEPSEAQWYRNELDEFIFFGRYNVAKAHGVPLTMTISTPSIVGDSVVYDPRERLGVALSSIKICELRDE